MSGPLDPTTLARDAGQTLPDDASLAQVSDLAQRQLALEDEIADLEARLSERRERLNRITFDELPAALAELGLRDIRLSNGARVEVQDFVQASIPERRREAAHAWLRDHGFGDLVKHELTVTFAKGEDAEAATAARVLEEHGWHPADRERVHPSTLKAFLREQIREGTEIPLDLFGAHAGQRTKITRPK